MRALPPWLTLLGSIFLLVMAFGFIFFVARGCVATQESTQIRKYVTSSDSILSDSTRVGTEELQPALENAGGDPSQIDAAALSSATDRSLTYYRDALTNDEVPPEFDGAHHYMISALGIRASAMERIARAAGNSEEFEEALATAVGDFRLSDSIIASHYIPASQEALRETGQRSDSEFLYEPAPFMNYETIGFSDASVSQNDSAVSDPNALHGVELLSVEVAGKPLYSGGNVTLTGSDELIFTVTVNNGGEVEEQNIPVEVVMNTSAERQARSGTMEQLGSGESGSVEISGLRPGQLEETADVTIEAGPVQYERNEENNTLTGTVTFGL